jgi:hypothetical protein
MRQVLGGAILVIAVIAVVMALVIVGVVLVVTALIRYWAAQVRSETYRQTPEGLLGEQEFLRFERHRLERARGGAGEFDFLRTLLSFGSNCSFAHGSDPPTSATLAASPPGRMRLLFRRI